MFLICCIVYLVQNNYKKYAFRFFFNINKINNRFPTERRKETHEFKYFFKIKFGYICVYIYLSKYSHAFRVISVPLCILYDIIFFYFFVFLLLFDIIDFFISLSDVKKRIKLYPACDPCVRKPIRVYTSCVFFFKLNCSERCRDHITHAQYFYKPISILTVFQQQ